MPEQPVVVLLGCGQEESDFLGNNNEFTEKIFGVEPRFISIDSSCTEAWWVGLPREAVVMIGNRRLIAQVQRDVSWSHVDPSAYEKTVRLVVCGGKYSENSEHVRHIVTQLFPYAAVHFRPSQFWDTEYESHMDISVLGLSKKASNALHRVGIRTLGDLVSMTRADLRKVNNVGAGTVNEIAENLIKRGLGLADTRREE